MSMMGGGGGSSASGQADAALLFLQAMSDPETFKARIAEFKSAESAANLAIAKSNVASSDLTARETALREMQIKFAADRGDHAREVATKEKDLAEREKRLASDHFELARTRDETNASLAGRERKLNLETTAARAEIMGKRQDAEMAIAARETAIAAREKAAEELHGILEKRDAELTERERKVAEDAAATANARQVHEGKLNALKSFLAQHGA